MTNLFNLSFYSNNFNRFIAIVDHRIRQKRKTFIVTANPEIIVQSKRNIGYYNILRMADYIVPDGVGVIITSHIIGQPIKDRITGIDIMTTMLDVADINRYKVYFYGGKDKILEKMIKEIRNKYANINICGYQHGYQNNDSLVVDEIKELKPDVVFVALGVPHQEKWIGNWVSAFSQGIFIGVGGSFDVISGEVKRAPSMMRLLRLEWLYRVMTDSKRRRKRFRYLIDFIKISWLEFRKEMSRIKEDNYK